MLFSNNFTCPVQLQAGLDSVVEKIAKGESIKSNLSKKIVNLKYNDDLLNDWGVYHLHLGTSLDNEGFVERTGPLLLARFDNVKAYLINIMPHGSWTKKEIITTVHKNWPESIAHFKMKLQRLEKEITDEDRKSLRRLHANTVVEMGGGVIYGPLGGGYTTSGLNAEVLRVSDFCFNQLSLYEIWIKENISILRKKLKNLNANFGAILIFSLEVIDNIAYALETVSKVRFKLGPVLP
ncbi:hypothetical protein NYE54_05495 [Paenibacillus sp. FSL K6-1330]|uniref:hypothetical protein n=1 Tax=Paenibacillus sp. FSL K6-1330 TaxID=2975292 RepID=UPI0030DAA7BA